MRANPTAARPIHCQHAVLVCRPLQGVFAWQECDLGEGGTVALLALPSAAVGIPQLIVFPTRRVYSLVPGAQFVQIVP
jgi:hypothetical protein